MNDQTPSLWPGLRIFMALLGGVVAVLVPTVWLLQQPAPPLPRICLCLAVGSFVVSVSAMQRPHWYLGTVLGFLVAMIPVTWVWVRGEDGGPASSGVIIFYLVFYGFLGLIIGSFGGLIGSLVGWGLTKNHQAGRFSSLKPWHLGIAVLGVDLLVTGIVLAFAA